MIRLLYLALFLISPEVFAGVFDPPPTDESVKILGTVFGSNIGNIYLGGAPNPILGQLMERFNFILVVAGSIIISYVGILSTINTAQEGTAMGKKWSAVWIPMRSIAGMMLMVPSPASGYSMIQVTVVWIIVQGIGAADQIWDLALDGLASGASAAVGQDAGDAVPSNAYSDGKNLAFDILNAAVCMETHYKAATDTFIDDDVAGNEENDTDVYRLGSKIKHYSEIKGEYPPKPKLDADGNKVLSHKVEGDSFFGLKVDNNDPNAEFKAVCGSIPVQGIYNIKDGVKDADVLTPEETLKLAQKIYDTKQLAISTMLTILQPLAEGIVENRVKPRKNGNSPDSMLSEKADTVKPNGFIPLAVDAYVKILSGLVVPREANDRVQEVADQGKAKGWIVAGAFYFVFNRSMTPRIHEDAFSSMSGSDIPTCTSEACMNFAYDHSGDLEDFITPDQAGNTALNVGMLSLSEDQTKLAKFLAQANVFNAADKDGGAFETGDLDLSLPASIGGNETKDAAAALKPVLARMQNGVQNMRDMMERGGSVDPMINHAIFGNKLMVGVEITWFVLMGIFILGSLPACIWSAISPTCDMFMTTILFVVTLAAPLLGLLWGVGASLAIYAPFIPFMIFTVTALGWLLVVVEAIIAAPLIALGLVTPSGDEMGKVAHGLTLLANIFLRPMLMIFGFLIAGRVYAAVIHLVNITMSQVFVAMEGIGIGSLFSGLLGMVVYCTFVISLANKSFSLIYAVPDKILRWLGGPAENTDVSQELGATKGGVESAGKQVSDAGTAATQKGLEGAIDSKKSSGGGDGGGDGGGGSGGDGGGAGGPKIKSGGKLISGGGTPPPVPPA